ncbi:uncharacterized protein EI97DRAFT_181029 [Westerdykella ornata]|uniref:Uncharacterized protein n=1 Tax=Westerdykella ornata TaxID=318751 RepID=A0A6A6JSQ8_WESOR|nr:uncharacterized protein EI97DRAFT_181029 [Westerdykella ornata]KAF2279592.1 hypothetical protein EI97DRAFT_181029 [Westerdykella ornata]
MRSTTRRLSSCPYHPQSTHFGNLPPPPPPSLPPSLLQYTSPPSIYLRHPHGTRSEFRCLGFLCTFHSSFSSPRSLFVRGLCSGTV